MRDALSLLDQAIAFGGGELKETDVCEMLGVIEKHHVRDVITNLINNDATGLLTCVQTMSEQSIDYETVLADLLSMLQRVAIAQVAPESIDDTQGDRDAVLDFADKISAEDVQLYYQIALIGRRDLSLAPQLRGGFEMVLLRMLSFQPAEIGAQVTKVKPAASATTPKPAATPAMRAAAPAKPVINTIAEKDIEVAVKPSATSDWSSIVEAMGIVGMVQQLAVHCTLISRDDKKWSLLLGNENKQLHSEKFENRLREALQSYLNSDIKLEIEVGKQQGETPAMQTERKKDERQQSAETDVASDTVVQSLQERFGATVQAVKPID
jgi:DNA polymerase-3 subunit gamma/tau